MLGEDAGVDLITEIRFPLSWVKPWLGERSLTRCGLQPRGGSLRESWLPDWSSAAFSVTHTCPSGEKRWTQSRIEIEIGCLDLDTSKLLPAQKFFQCFNIGSENSPNLDSKLLGTMMNTLIYLGQQSNLLKPESTLTDFDTFKTSERSWMDLDLSLNENRWILRP